MYCISMSPLLTASGLSTSLQDLWRGFMPNSTQWAPAQVNLVAHNRPITPYSIANSAHHMGTEHQKHSKIKSSMPLRVVQVLETGQAPIHAGRMLISGRMADVCAELDRLAAREAALH